MSSDTYPIRYRHGCKRGQVVSLVGLLGSCSICGAPVGRLVWDRREVKPFKNYMGFWCRRFSPIEPPHRKCERHRVEEAITLRFKTDEDWRRWVAKQESDNDR